MTEDQAYEKLQELLSIVEELITSGHYTPEEILDEVKGRIG